MAGSPNTYSIIETFLGTIYNITSDGVDTIWVSHVYSGDCRVTAYTVSTDSSTDIASTTFNDHAGNSATLAYWPKTGKLYAIIRKSSTEIRVYEYSGTGTSWSQIDSQTISSSNFSPAYLAGDPERLVWSLYDAFTSQFFFRATTDGSTWANQTTDGSGNKPTRCYYAADYGAVVIQYMRTTADFRIGEHSSGNSWIALSASNIGNYPLIGTADGYQFFGHAANGNNLYESTNWGVTQSSPVFQDDLNYITYWPNTGYGALIQTDGTNYWYVYYWDPVTNDWVTDVDDWYVSEVQVPSPVIINNYIFFAENGTNLWRRDAALDEISVGNQEGHKISVARDSSNVYVANKFLDDYYRALYWRVASNMATCTNIEPDSAAQEIDGGVHATTASGVIAYGLPDWYNFYFISDDYGNTWTEGGYPTASGLYATTLYSLRDGGNSSDLLVTAPTAWTLDLVYDENLSVISTIPAFRTLSQVRTQTDLLEEYYGDTAHNFIGKKFVVGIDDEESGGIVKEDELVLDGHLSSDSVRGPARVFAISNTDFVAFWFCREDDDDTLQRFKAQVVYTDGAGTITGTGTLASWYDPEITDNEDITSYFMDRLSGYNKFIYTTPRWDSSDGTAKFWVFVVAGDGTITKYGPQSFHDFWDPSYDEIQMLPYLVQIDEDTVFVYTQWVARIGATYPVVARRFYILTNSGTTLSSGGLSSEISIGSRGAPYTLIKLTETKVMVITALAYGFIAWVDGGSVTWPPNSNWSYVREYWQEGLAINHETAIGGINNMGSGYGEVRMLRGEYGGGVDDQDYFWFNSPYSLIHYMGEFRIISQGIGYENTLIPNQDEWHIALVTVYYTTGDLLFHRIKVDKTDYFGYSYSDYDVTLKETESIGSAVYSSKSYMDKLTHKYYCVGWAGDSGPGPGIYRPYVAVISQTLVDPDTTGLNMPPVKYSDDGGVTWEDRSTGLPTNVDITDLEFNT